MSDFTPDTIVLVHGLWMTPRSWEGWVAHFEENGYKVLTPAYPGFEIEVEALRENPDIIANQTVPAIIDHITAMIGKLDKQPIIMGHSFGGTITQLLMDRGLGCSGVVIDSAPTEGVRVNPPSQAKSAVPGAEEPGQPAPGGRVHPQEFHYAFTNTLSKEDSDKVYDRYHIAAPGSFVWEVRAVRQLQTGQAGHLGELPQRRPGATALHRRRVGPHHAAVGEQVELQALEEEVEGTHRVPRVPRPLALDVRRAGLGGSG